MTHPLDDPASVCRVLRNARGELSLWLASMPMPAGWTPVFGPAAGSLCLAAIPGLHEAASAAPRPQAGNVGIVPLALGFEQQAAERPEATALRCEGLSLSYAQLNARANRLAHALIAQGAAPGSIVALLLPRSVDLAIAMLATAKAGAAYLPIDPDYPDARIAFTLADARPVCVITHEALTPRIDAALPRLVLDLPEPLLEPGTAMPRNPRDADRAQPLRLDHPAYLIYTSGSTGTPKAVLIAQRSLLLLFQGTARHFDFDHRDVWTLFHSCAFDFSVWEFWGALLHGGCLVIVPQSISRSPRDFLELLVRERVTVLNQTPSAFVQLAQADAALPALSAQLRLRTVIFGGETLDPARLADWYRRHADDAPRLFNLYGITETTVHVTLRALRAEDATASGRSPIGAAIPGLELHLLDADLLPVAIGEIGELHVSGSGLAIAYLNQPGLTAARFIANPHGEAGSRLYRSGDLARRRADGELDFIGRADLQIKLRGFRIELGEIEARLLRQPGLADAAASLQAGGDGEPRLVAHVVAQPGQSIDLRALRQQLARELPAYMLPAVINGIAALPLNANGKLDRHALPAACFEAGPIEDPASALESRLARLFAEALGQDQVGLDDNFFDLGGSSLQLVRLHAAIISGLKCPLTMVELFSYPRVRALAQWLQSASRTSPSLSVTETHARAQRRQAQLAQARAGLRPSGI